MFGLVSGHLDGAVVSSSITPLHKTETHEDWADARCARNSHCKITSRSHSLSLWPTGAQCAFKRKAEASFGRTVQSRSFSLSMV